MLVIRYAYQTEGTRLQVSRFDIDGSVIVNLEFRTVARKFLSPVKEREEGLAGQSLRQGFYFLHPSSGKTVCAVYDKINKRT